MVEAWFETLEDLNAFASSDNFKTTVDPDHANFIDLTTVNRIVCEEAVVAP